MSLLFDGLQFKIKKYLRKIKSKPDDYLSHYMLGKIYASQKRWVPAIAEYRTSIALGNDQNDVILSLAVAYNNFGHSELAKKTCELALMSNPGFIIKNDLKQILTATETRQKNWIASLNHNTFYRIRTLSEHIEDIFPSKDISVLDVGGGEGLLSLFLPDAEYMLIEPTINGISALCPQISQKKFDCVVACHVIEHVAIENRDIFLDSLCSLSNDYVILMNPFYDNSINQKEWQQMLFDITGASWVKEHIDCIMPKIEDIISFAQRRSYKYRIIPNGSKMMTLAMVLLDHYMSQVDNHDDVERINEMFNNIVLDKLVNEKWPNAYLIEIKLNR